MELRPGSAPSPAVLTKAISPHYTSAARNEPSWPRGSTSKARHLSESPGCLQVMTPSEVHLVSSGPLGHGKREWVLFVLISSIFPSPRPKSSPSRQSSRIPLVTWWKWESQLQKMCKQQSYRFTRFKWRKKRVQHLFLRAGTAICVKATVRFPKWSWEARHSPKGLQEDFGFWMSFLGVAFYFPDSQMFLSSKILRDFIFLFPSLFLKDNKQSHLQFPVTFYACYF